MKSYTYWPVKLWDLDTETHITCNWFGKTPTTQEQVTQLTAHLKTDFIADHPFVNFEQFNPWTYVIQLTPAPETIKVHEALAQIRPHDYPTWQPHITVPKFYWEELKRNNVNDIRDLLEDVPGPLTLRIKP